VKFGIRYETIYRYDRAVRFSPHDVRLFPRTDRFVQMTRLDFRTKPETTVRFERDVFDNIVASCFFDQPSEMLELRLAIDVEAVKKSFRFCFVASCCPNTLQLRARYRLDYLRLLQTPNGRVHFVGRVEAAFAGIAARDCGNAGGINEDSPSNNFL